MWLRFVYLIDNSIAIIAFGLDKKKSLSIATGVVVAAVGCVQILMSFKVCVFYAALCGFIIICSSLNTLMLRKSISHNFLHVPCSSSLDTDLCGMINQLLLNVKNL